jgi:hypothetical protein
VVDRWARKVTKQCSCAWDPCRFAGSRWRVTIESLVDVGFRRHAGSELGIDQLSVFGTEHVRHDEHVQDARGLAREPEHGDRERECAASARRRHLGEPPHTRRIPKGAFLNSEQARSQFLSPSALRLPTLFTLDTKSQVRVPDRR